MKKIIAIFVSVLGFLQAECYIFSCNGSIQYAIGRYSDKTIQRLEDYRKTIRGSSQIERLYQKILKAQNRELNKTIARATLENIEVKEILHLSNRERALSRRYNDTKKRKK